MLRPRSRPVLLSLAVAGVLLTAACSSDAPGTTAREANATPTVDTAEGSGTTPGTATEAPATTDEATGAGGTRDTSDTSGTDDSGAPTSTDGADVDPPDDADRAGPTPDTTDAFGWEEVDDGIEEGHLEVPIDPSRPDGDTFDLAVVRHRATDQQDRIGSLLVNPGGPGYGGTDLAYFAEQIYGGSVLAHFDIVAWDPRGTGASEPAIDCVDDYDEFFALDSSPDTAAEQDDLVRAATEFGEDCASKNAAVLPYVSTENSAFDMDQIRQALGEDTISYFGFSYGSELGIAWASLYPDTVRAMVVDGAADTTVGYLEQNLEQAAGFEATFDTFLANCAADDDCAFHNDGDPQAAFDALNQAADADPVATTPGRPDVTQGVLTTAVSDAMYDESYWPQLEQALADLQDGDGTGVLALYDDYYDRQTDGSYGDALEAYFAINCIDDPGTKDPEVLFGMQDDFHEVAPRLGASWILELLFCAAWPEPAAPAVAADAAGAGPIVVVGTTGDPATPLEGTRHTAEALEDGHLVVVEADQHTGYGVNECVDGAVDDYLVGLVVPDDGLVCDG